MNLALLNPFRQADRIDSTLAVPRALHPPRPMDRDGDRVDASTATNNTTGADASAERGDEKKSPSSKTATPASSFKITQRHMLDDDGQGLTTKDEETNDGTRGGSAVVGALSMTAAEGTKPNAEESATHSKSIEMDTRENEEEQVKGDEMKNVREMATGDRSRREDNIGDVKDNAITPKGEGDITVTPKLKKKRKKKGQREDTASDDEDDSENNDEDEESENYWTACYAVTFNRRGSFLASGHASGLVPVHDFLGRTPSALYRPPPGIRLGGKNNAGVPLSSFAYNDINTGSGKDAGSGSKQDSGEGKESSGKKRRALKPKKRHNDKGKDKMGKGGSKGGSLSPFSMVKISSSDDLLVSAKVVEEKVKEKAMEDSADTAVCAIDGAAMAADLSDNQLEYVNGVTSLSWDRRSRTLLAGAIGDKNLRLYDNTHPLVATDCTDAVRRHYLAESGGKDFAREKNNAPFNLEEKKASVIAACTPLVATLPYQPEGHGEGRIAIRVETVSLGRARLLRSNIMNERASSPSFSTLFSHWSLLKPIMPGAAQPRIVMTGPVPARRHPALLLELPRPLGGPVELHPRDGHAGLACMIDGSLALFWVPPMAFYETLPLSMTVVGGDRGGEDNVLKQKWVANLLREEESGRVGNLAYLVHPPGVDGGGGNKSSAAKTDYFITCAAFDKHGEVIWAVTKCGNLLAFRVELSTMNMLRGCGDGTSSAAVTFAHLPAARVKVPGGAAAWQIIVSRNGRYILINSADCSLRLYDVEELSKIFDGHGDTNRIAEVNIKPRFVFQDNISKAPWASCDFSGDGEYVVGGCNSYPQPGDNYKLFLWNCITGELVDQLTGPVSSLYSLSCHPTRPFIAVGTSDGLVDVWGARLDWVAFAPDFQALQQNELYNEKEDEFDVVVDSSWREENGKKGKGSSYGRLAQEDHDVDITTVDIVPAFDSESEDELDVFYFDTKVDKLLSEKQPGPKKAEHE